MEENAPMLKISSKTLWIFQTLQIWMGEGSKQGVLVGDAKKVPYHCSKIQHFWHAHNGTFFVKNFFLKVWDQSVLVVKHQNVYQYAM